MNKLAMMIEVAILIAVPAAAQKVQHITPCFNQWVVQMAPEMSLAYDIAHEASKNPVSQTKPPQVMVTGDELAPYLVAVYQCADLWMPPASVEYTITSVEDARRAWALWLHDVKTQHARKTGLQTFGYGDLAMAWVIR